MRNRFRCSGRTVIATGCFALAACGAGGVGHVASSPPAPTPSTPTSPPPVRIFNNPTPAEYTSVSASIAGPGGNLDTYDSAAARFGAVSTAEADQARIRYNSGGYYEIDLPGADWDRLVQYKGTVNPHPDNNYFQPSSVPMNEAYLVTSISRDKGYLYSELGSWGSATASRFGYMAFGQATPVGGVPTVGSATYSGMVVGSADFMTADNLYGGYVSLGVEGTVQLNFDFGNGTLGGSMSLSFPDGMNPADLGTFTFRDTVFSAGSTTYSGSFNTAVSGQNFFLGRFTGPAGEETIGAWALPFVFDRGGEYLLPDGQTHQAFGSWIAKRGN